VTFTNWQYYMDPEATTVHPTSTDIALLLAQNLKLQKHPKEIEAIFRNNGITKVSHLVNLEVTDLISLGIPTSDLDTILKAAKQSLNPLPRMDSRNINIAEWLRENGLEQYEDRFINLSAKMLPFIRRSDLPSYLSISPLDCPLVWNALQKLPRQFPPPFEPMDDSCELIRTTMYPPITVELNEFNYVEHIKQADTTRSAVKVSFVGDTGVGKSLTISQLLTFEDRIRYGRGPLVASSSQSEATTGNVCLYYTLSRDQKHRFILLDFEGVYGSSPLRLKNVWAQAMQSVDSNEQPKNAIVQFQKERENVVKAIFPQLAYLISNVVVLVDRQLPYHTSYLDKLEKFAEASTRNPGPGEKPFLIIIQNFADPDQQGNKDAYDIEESTAEFLHCIQEYSKAQSLLQHYRQVCFLRLPSWSSHPILYDKQIYLLHNKILSYAEILRRESCFSRVFWSDRFWFTYVKSLCTEFKSTLQELNVPKVLTNVIAQRASPLQRILNFWLAIWTPPIVGSKSQKRTVEDWWYSCFEIALERYAGLLFEELQPQLQSINDLEKPMNKIFVVTSVKQFCDEIWDYSPCLQQLPKGRVCGITKIMHTTGHYGQDGGEHNTPQIPTDRNITVQNHIKILFSMNSVAKVEHQLDLLFRGLQRKSPNERQQDTRRWIPFCMSCLNKFTKEQSYRLMACSHVICEVCAVRKDMFCPFHGQRVAFADVGSRIPGHAQVRILSIDGGDVRGIIPIRILARIEEWTGYKIHQLFDLIVGSGIGAVVGLAAGIKRDFMNSYTQFFLECPQKIFKLDFWKKLGIWINSKYDDKPVINALQELFENTLTMSRCALPNNCLVAVAAHRKTSESMSPVFITNYVHGEGLAESKEYAGPRLIHNCYVWEAAKVALSIPAYFKPWTIGENEYFDGSLVANNPSVYALQEATSLWKRRIDTMVSIGTGFTAETSPKKGDGQIAWHQKTVNVVTETVTTVTQASLICRQNNVTFFRVSPNLQETIITDMTTKDDLMKLAKETEEYLEINAKEIKSLCRQLVASLLYVAEINFPMHNATEPINILIKSRVSNFTIPRQLCGTWRLDCSTLRGEMKRNIVMEDPKKQAIARIFIQPETAECLVSINAIIDDNAYPISGGDCVNVGMSAPLRNEKSNTK